MIPLKNNHSPRWLEARIVWWRPNGYTLAAPIAGRLGFGSIRDAVRLKSPPGPSVGIDRGVIAWPVLVFALLFLGLAPLYILHLDLAKLNASTAGAAPIALVGILFTAYTSDSCRNRAWRSV